ncbi:MAG: peptidoglycan DD-metalloendopeptidase family protein [Acidobacteriota bacterium]
MPKDIIGTNNGQQFFVGQDTPSVAPPPVSTPTTPTSPVRRYTAPAPSPAPSLPVAPTVAKPKLQTVDENAIREETRKRMQGTIDAINANYANLISQEQVAGQDRSGQTRSIVSRSGLMGSDFGQAQQEKTTQFNQQQVKYLEEEKQAKVNAVLLNIEDRASEAIKERKAEAQGQYERDMDAFTQAQEQARGDLKTLASSGVDLKQLNPAQRAALAKQAGYEDNDMFDLVYNAMKKKSEQIDYKFEKLADGKGLFYGIDPITGELVTKNVEMDIPDDMDLTIAPDGTPILFNRTKGIAQIAPGFGQGEFLKPEETDPTYGGLTKEQRTELQRVQGNVRQDPDIKDFIITRDGYERVQTGANQNNAQGDLALLFGFMKMLDPNSVVRETEFANAEQAQGTLQRWFNIPDKFIKGTRLTEEGRRYFADAAKDLYSRKEMSYQRAVDFYGNQLDQFGIPREMGLRDFGTTFEDEPVSLTPLNGNDPRRFTNPLVNKYPYLEVASFVQQYPDATEAEIQELIGNSPGNFTKGGSTPYLKTLGAITGLDGSKYWKWGLDVDVKKGDPVKAPVSGTVIYAGANGGFGNQVKIRTDDGKEIWLSHFDALKVKKGQRVNAGQVIALGGNSGKVYSNGGDGSHVDITMPKGNGSYYTAREVKSFLDKSYV